MGEDEKKRQEVFLTWVLSFLNPSFIWFFNRFSLFTSPPLHCDLGLLLYRLQNAVEVNLMANSSGFACGSNVSNVTFILKNKTSHCIKGLA